MKKAMITVVILAAVSFLTPAWAGPNFNEGMWEIKASMKMEGLPFPMPAIPVNYSQCITKKDMVPQQQEKNKDCTKVSEKIEGNVVSWVMKCTNAKDGTITESTGTATYAGATFNAKIQNVITDAKGKRSQSSMTMTGRRTGECK